MKELFAPKVYPYGLHNNDLLQKRTVNYVSNSTEPVSYLQSSTKYLRQTLVFM